MKGWRKGRLGDFIELKRGYDLPKKQRQPGDVPVVSSSGITGTHSTGKVRAPGVVTGRYGTLGEVFYLTNDFWPLNTTLYVRNFKGNHPRFVSYFLETLSFQEFADKAAVPGINRNHLHEARVAFPPRPEQERIAQQLGDLDDKADLTRRMNETLEATARAIFKSWFVDFDPVRAKMEGRQPFGMFAETAALFPDEFYESSMGPVPLGWKLDVLESVAPPSKESLNPQAFPGEIFDHFSIPAFDAGASPEVQLGAEIKSAKRVLPPGAVLLSRLNPRFHRTWWADAGERRGLASTEFLVAKPSGQHRAFVYCLFQSDSFRHRMSGLVGGTSGSHQRVNQRTLLAMTVRVPPPDLLRKFDEVATPLLTRRAVSVAESARLAALRDQLLSALMRQDARA